MNPFSFILRQIWGIIKFVVLDTIEDVKTLFKVGKGALNGEEVFDKVKVDMLKAEIMSLTPLNVVKRYWHWLILVAFACSLTWLVCSQFYQVECNNFIIEQYINKSFGYVAMPSGNLSELPFHAILP